MEILCRILDYLPIYDVMKLECLCRKMRCAVTMHLRLIISVDFSISGTINRYVPSRLSDTAINQFLKRSPEVTFIYGLHLYDGQILRRKPLARNPSRPVLTIQGVVRALRRIKHLRGIETSDIFLLQAILESFPSVHILGKFSNRTGSFPPLPRNRITLSTDPNVTHLHLTSVILPGLPRMDHVRHLYLRWCMMTDTQPFGKFSVPNLRTFVMNNCGGLTNMAMFVPLVSRLSEAKYLSRLEFVRVPLLGGF